MNADLDIRFVTAQSYYVATLPPDSVLLLLVSCAHPCGLRKYGEKRAKKKGLEICPPHLFPCFPGNIFLLYGNFHNRGGQMWA